ncbi:general substrate transporter [Ilyonectria robusta]|uniref:general substrate transporter n=1 Tax=Ilyonectria robusta TaxID=1079257 RepID=UPI001E8E6CB4|nr:general substrate transporter [Ilyonectria robusta]KAH8656284.1 general substrate transporter [Ilyonectria robusta]
MWITELEGRALTVGITSTCGTAFMLFGFDQGVFGGILQHPLFQLAFNQPSAMIQGQIVSTYDLGCILGALLTIFVGDILGRRKTISLGCVFVALGGIIQSSSYSLAQMIVGRIAAGLGVGMNSVAVPIWQSETCKPEHRGKLIAIQLAVVIGGIAFSNWMNLGFTYVVDSHVSWRFPLAFQSLIALLAIALLACMPESPRWLCTKDRHTEAQAIIGRLLAKPADDPSVVESLRLIASSIAHERELAQVGWRDIFSSGAQQNFRRIALGAGTSLMQQMGGINVVVYYMPVILTVSFDFNSRQALILSACDFISLMIWGGLVMLVIDKWGRKRLMLIGAFAQGICFAIAAAGLGVGTKASQAVAVTAIFLYHVFFGLSFLSIPFCYPSEINSQRMRNVGSSIAMITNWIFVYVIVLITPIGIDSIGWKFYIIFAVTNIAWLPLIWYFYIETAGLSLEEIDRLFEIQYEGGKGMSWKKATSLAKQDVALTNMQNSEKNNEPMVQHSEIGSE